MVLRDLCRNSDFAVQALVQCLGYQSLPLLVVFETQNR